MNTRQMNKKREAQMQENFQHKREKYNDDVDSLKRPPINRMAESRGTQNKAQYSNFNSPPYNTEKEPEFQPFKRSPSPGFIFSEPTILYSTDSLNMLEDFNGQEHMVQGNSQHESMEHNYHLDSYRQQPLNKMDRQSETQKKTQLSNRNSPAHKEPDFQSNPNPSHLGEMKQSNWYKNQYRQEHKESNENEEVCDSFSCEEDSAMPATQASPTVKHRGSAAKHQSTVQPVQITEKYHDISRKSPPKKSRLLTKTIPNKSDSGYTILYVAIGILVCVIVSVLGSILYYKNGLSSIQTPSFKVSSFFQKASQPLSQIDITAIMDDLKSNFNEQPSMTFKIVKSSIQTLNKLNPKEPAIIALLAEQGAEDISRRFARQLTESVLPNGDVVTISGHAYTEEETDVAKKAIDDLLNGGLKENGLGAVFVDRLDYIPGDAALIFHTYCDHENAPFKRVVYVMTVVSNETKLELGGPKEWDTKFQEHLYKSWNAMGMDQISSLMSRLTVSVAAIVPKDEN